MKPGLSEFKLFLVDLDMKWDHVLTSPSFSDALAFHSRMFNLVGGAQDIFVVSRPSHTDDMLHTFGVVHLPEDCGKSHWKPENKISVFENL